MNGKLNMGSEDKNIIDYDYAYKNCLKECSKSVTRMIGWKRAFSLICIESDFRTLLTLKQTCKDLSAIAELEIQKRNNEIAKLSTSFYSDVENWHLGRRCKGYVREIQGVGNKMYPISRKCSLWEEITEMGIYQLCRRCRKSLKENTRSIKLKSMYQPSIPPDRVNRLVQRNKKFFAKNEDL